MQTKPLTFKNQYMFGRVLCQEDICKGFIERVLGLKVEKIHYLNREQVLEPQPATKGVRLDVYVETDKGSFDIELQSQPQELGRRMRYYQSAIDSRLLDKGENYDLLPESYIIFVCDFDPYTLGLPVYLFECLCKDAPKLDANCGFHWVVLNSKAADVAPSEGLRHMLEYIANGVVAKEDTLITRIDREVQQANNDTKWVSAVSPRMSLEQDFKLQGKLQGRAEAKENYSKLISILIEANRIDDLKTASQDPAFLEELFKEFDL